MDPVRDRAAVLIDMDVLFHEVLVLPQPEEVPEADTHQPEGTGHREDELGQCGALV